jgi:two-component system LytT family response regulator
MSRLKTLIVDDEQHCRELLFNLLQRKFPEIEIIGEATNVENAFDMICEKKPDLVFLDVCMPRADGFELLKRFEKRRFEVVFVTSYDEYALAAIKHDALDYLLKPVDPAELRNAVARAFQNRQQSSGRQPRIIQLQLQRATDERRFAIHYGEKVKLVSDKEILYIEADSRYCILHLSNQEQYTTARHLKEFEVFFGDTSSFIRINKTFMINTAYIKEYTKGEFFSIEMNNGIIFDVSRRKKAVILDKLKKVG